MNPRNFGDERKRSKPALLGRSQLIARPLDRDFRERVEAFQGTLGRSVVIMVSFDDRAI